MRLVTLVAVACTLLSQAGALASPSTDPNLRIDQFCARGFNAICQETVDHSSAYFIEYYSEYDFLTTYLNTVRRLIDKVEYESATTSSLEIEVKVYQEIEKHYPYSSLPLILDRVKNALLEVVDQKPFPQRTKESIAKALEVAQLVTPSELVASGEAGKEELDKYCNPSFVHQWGSYPTAAVFFRELTEENPPQILFCPSMLHLDSFLEAGGRSLSGLIAHEVGHIIDRAAYKTGFSYVELYENQALLKNGVDALYLEEEFEEWLREITPDQWSAEYMAKQLSHIRSIFGRGQILALTLKQYLKWFCKESYRKHAHSHPSPRNRVNFISNNRNLRNTLECRERPSEDADFFF